MILPNLNPLLASSALSAIRAHPESGLMSVPFFVPSEDGRTLGALPKAMGLDNLTEATLNLVALARFAEDPEEPWKREIFSTPNRMHFSNSETGQGVHIEIGTALPRAMTGSSRGLSVSARRFGDFGGTSMTAFFDPTLKTPFIPLLYEIELTEAGLLGLRNELKWEEKLPIYELSLKLFHHLNLRGDVQSRNPYAELQQDSLQNEWTGTEPAGAFVTLIGGLDDAMSEAYGDIVERLRIEVTPNDDPPALSDALKPIWAYADQVATESNAHHRAEEIKADRESYRNWVRRVYGSDSLPPSGRGKD